MHRVLRQPGRSGSAATPLCQRQGQCANCHCAHWPRLHMGMAVVIWPNSCLSYRKGPKLSDVKNVRRCSKVKDKIECHPAQHDVSLQTRGHTCRTITRLICGHGAEAAWKVERAAKKTALPPGPEGHRTGLQTGSTVKKGSETSANLHMWV